MKYYIISGLQGGQIKIWDMSTGRCLKIVKKHEGLVLSLLGEENSQNFYSGGADNKLIKWDIQTGNVIYQRTLQLDWIRNIKEIYGTSNILCSGESKYIEIRNQQNLKKIKKFCFFKENSNSTEIHFNRKLIYTCGDNSIIKVACYYTGKILKEITKQNIIYTCILIQQNNWNFFTANKQSIIVCWDFFQKSPRQIYRKHFGGISNMVFGYKQRIIYSADSYGIVVVWSSQNKKSIKCFSRLPEFYAKTICSVKFRNLLAIGTTQEPLILLWNPRNTVILRKFPCFQGDVYSLLYKEY